MLTITRESYLLWDTLIAIVGLIFLIAKFRLHPFLTLILAAGFIGLTSGMPLHQIVESFQKGFGGVLGFVAVVLGLGTMLGKMTAESGATEQIATTLIDKFGKNRVHWAMMVVAFIVGIPVFFEVGFVLLIPLLFTIARKLNISLIKIGIPLAAGLSVVHGLVPPHPAPILAINIYNADVGRTLFYALIVGLPTAIIAGPLFGSFISRYVDAVPPPELAAQLTRKEDNQQLPSFGISIFTILLPVGLMLLTAIADILLPKENQLRQWVDFIGNPIVALLIALLFSFWVLGTKRGFTRKNILDFMNACLAPTAVIILIIGAGGGFKQLLIDSGVGDAIAKVAINSTISPVFLGWLVAALIRVATGSATVAMITAAGIVAPIAAQVAGTNRELLVLATGAGSLILSHVNDAGFWLIKEYYNLSVGQTLKTWTVMETLVSVVAIVFISIINFIV